MNPQLVQAEHAWIALALTGAGIGIAWVLYTAWLLARSYWLQWRIRTIFREIPCVALPPRLAPPPSQTARPQALYPVAGRADRVATIGDQESGYLTTTLRRVK